MSTVYSLCCFKGSTGATVTMSIASPCVVTLSAHGVVTGLPVVFTTTGALPTGITAGTTYYARYVNAATFHLYDTEAHAFDTASTTGRINTSGSQSGTHTIWSSFWYNLSTDDRLNYGSAGSERVYAGQRAWQTARSAATGELFTEVLEHADPIEEPVSTTAAITYANFPCYSIVLTSKVNGERSKAFHFGHVDRGYCIKPASYVGAIRIERSRIKVDGLRGYSNVEAGSFIYMVSGFDCEICNNIGTGGTYGSAFHCSGTAFKIYNNLAWGGYWGFRFNSYGNAFSLIYNNLAVKCTNTGMIINGSPVYGNYYNNVSIGCATNWSSPPSNPNDGGMKNNVGASGDTPWGTDPITTLTTAHFLDWTNNDFRYTSDSPLIDAGITLVDGEPSDMFGSLRPNYSAGNATSDEWDCGCFEYDSGNGEPPVSLTIPGIVSGSDIVIYEAGTTTVLDSVDELMGTSWDYVYGTSRLIDIGVFKSGYVPKYVRNYMLTGVAATLPEVTQTADRNYA